jgi:hypothetical protein
MPGATAAATADQEHLHTTCARNGKYAIGTERIDILAVRAADYRIGNDYTVKVFERLHFVADYDSTATPIPALADICIVTLVGRPASSAATAKAIYAVRRLREGI